MQSKRSRVTVKFMVEKLSVTHAAHWVRDTLELEGLEQDFPRFAGACAISSYILWLVLRAEGHAAVLVCVVDHKGTGEGHCWVEVDGLVVDITATQFDGKKVCIFPIGTPSPHHRGRHLYELTGENRFENDEAIREVSDWDVQSPFSWDSLIESVISENSVAV